MSRVEVLSIELPNHQGSLRYWEDALFAFGERISPSSRDQTVIRVRHTVGQGFSGRIEFGALGAVVLYKVMATPSYYSRSFRADAAPLPVMLYSQVSGSSRFKQDNRSCTLNPQDWCVVDRRSFEGWSLGTGSEVLAVALQPPTDPEVCALLNRGTCHRWDGKTGTARVLQAALAEAFKQMNRLGPRSGRTLHGAVTEMTWDALREQLDAPAPLVHQDMQRARIKGYIESQLADPELSVGSIAQGCGMSVRSVHRVFAADPAGSVSKFVWMRRLSHCATILRDPKQAHRPITDICCSWGFNSTSHFDRLFKEQFGVAPGNRRASS